MIPYETKKEPYKSASERSATFFYSRKFQFTIEMYIKCSNDKKSCKQMHGFKNNV